MRCLRGSGMLLKEWKERAGRNVIFFTGLISKHINMDVEELVMRNVEWIKRKARYYVHNKDDADDLASETIYRCLQNAKKFDVSRDFKPWVKTIMENIFKSQAAHRKRYPVISTEECPWVADNDMADSLVAITRFLSILREYTRHTVNMECVILYAKGYSYAEIAQKVGIVIGTVKSRIANGRKSVSYTQIRAN